MVDKISNQKEKFKKKLEKNMTKGLCYGNENRYEICTWKNYTLEQLLLTPVGKEVLKKKIAEIQSQGHTILNTNLEGLI